MISALVLAAGESKRMGQPKMLLPWGKTTVIGKVIFTLFQAGLTDVCVVTGGNYTGVKEALAEYNSKLVFNPDYADGEMLTSVKVGLKEIEGASEAALIVLGDQPQIEAGVVKIVMDSYLSARPKIVVPSYQMHRGHPWLIDHALWNEITVLSPPNTLRDYLIQNQGIISYVNVNTPSILQDLDTPREYLEQKP